MKIKPTPLKYCYSIEPTVFGNRRGCFYKKYRTQNFENRV
ncbi:hypothetical protein EIH08_03010 [Chryseobacterium taklimakanense]|uniref:dTDP-4-dehydrorhamnose 3,5-epimerase n=1 Tax=Chryseobacterium taklimakanense TaxID=536441 RepID=A0A3G8WH21_9FLAO|nr:hypothetical protein EIH08_03010 [Chryseobacterium taklimakanense]